MSGDEHLIPDDQLVDAMASYDDLLAAGGSSPSEAISETVDPSLLPEWDRLVAFLTLVERAWPRVAAAADHQTLPAPAAMGPDVTPADPGPDGQFGRFRILRALGQGGSGIVFLAWDPALRREVALKVPQPEALVTPEARKRFLREARAAAGLDHLNIIPVHEAGRVGTVDYIASAYCPGPTLARWLCDRDRPVPPRDAAGLVATLARAVDHAHERGVLHRDLKPSNVLIQKPGAREPGHEDQAPADLEPRITDFSLAWLADGEGPKTLSGVPLGSPSYMAPEQAEGRLKAIGPATDVYGLGCILYEILTRHPPFRGESQVEILRRVVADDAPSPRRLRKDLPAELEAIVLKCLMKAPAGRYPTARELAEDLDRFLAGEPTQARPAGRWRRLRRRVGRHPAAMAVLAIVAVSATALLAGVRWYEARLDGARLLSRQDGEESRTRERQDLRHRQYTGAILQADQLIRESQASAALEVLLRQRPRPGEEDLRDFAWHLLMRRCHSEGHTLSGHRGAVYYVDFSPGGDRLASAGVDGTVRIWDTTSWRRVRQIEASPREVNVATFSPDGRTLATVDDEGMLKLWDAATGQPEWAKLAHRGDAVIARFTRDGRRIITGGRTDHSIRIWDRSGGAMIVDLPITDPTGNGGALENAVVSPDGSILATAGVGAVRLWDLARRALLVELPGSWGAQGLAFSHDGAMLATSHEEDWTIQLRGVPDGRVLREFRGHPSGVFSVAFSRDDRTLISAGQDGTIRFWSVADGRQSGVHQGHKDRVWTLALSPDGRSLASAGADGTAKIWDAGPPINDPKLPIPRPGNMAFSRDGQSLLVMEYEQPYLISSWDTNSGELRGRRPLDVPPARASLFSRDGRLLALSHEDGAITIWDSEDGHPIGRTDPVSGRQYLVDFSLDRRYLLVQGHGGGFSLWDLIDRRWFHITWDGGGGVALAPSGEIAVLLRDDRLVWWDPPTDRRRSLAFRRPHRTAWLTSSPDGRMLASTDPGTNKIHLWSAQTLELLQELPGHPVHIGPLLVSPDGKTLASAGADRMVRLSNILTGEETLALTGYRGVVDHMRFSPDGRSLATSSSDARDRIAISLWRTARDEAAPAAPSALHGTRSTH